MFAGTLNKVSLPGLPYVPYARANKAVPGGGGVQIYSQTAKVVF